MRAARTDANQQAIVDALKICGASVESLHRVGGGVPDLLVGFRGSNYLLEVKTESGDLNALQIEWHGLWRGKVRVVRNIHEALEAIGAVK